MRMSNEHTRFYSLLPVRTFFNFYKSQLHTSTIPTLKHELLNSLLTFSSRKVLRCRQTQIWFGLPMQSLCSKGYSVLSALQMAVEKFVCMRVFFTFLGYL